MEGFCHRRGARLWASLPVDGLLARMGECSVGVHATLTPGKLDVCCDGRCVNCGRRGCAKKSGMHLSEAMKLCCLTSTRLRAHRLSVGLPLHCQDTKDTTCAINHTLARLKALHYNKPLQLQQMVFKPGVDWLAQPTPELLFTLEFDQSLRATDPFETFTRKRVHGGLSLGNIKPPTMTWDQACSVVRRVPQRPRAPRQSPIDLLGCGTEPSRHGLAFNQTSFGRGLMAGASGLAHDLAARGVLCNFTSKCTVEVRERRHLVITLPLASSSFHLCEPFGELWQQARPSKALGPTHPDTEDECPLLTARWRALDGGTGWKQAGVGGVVDFCPWRARKRRRLRLCRYAPTDDRWDYREGRADGSILAAYGTGECEHRHGAPGSLVLLGTWGASICHATEPQSREANGTQTNAALVAREAEPHQGSGLHGRLSRPTAPHESRGAHNARTNMCCRRQWPRLEMRPSTWGGD